MKTFFTVSTEETQKLGKNSAKKMMPGAFICLRGDLGVGKTTFTQGLLEGLGAEGPFVSPTFVIMKQYDLPKPINGIERVYHIDAYRVTVKDFEVLGFSEWCEDKKGIIILEWPERIEALLPKKRVEVHFRSISENEREISIEEK